MSEFDYSHRYHAGNVGDVWKHCVLLALLRALLQRCSRLRVVETHAGEGLYALGATGEWTEGVGRLWAAQRSIAESTELLRDYNELVRRLGLADGHTRRYPGSPALSLATLREPDQLVLCELVPSSYQRLAEQIGTDPRVELHCGDGLALLPELLAQGGDDRTLVVVDPTYQDKAEWTRLVEVFSTLELTRPELTVMLWYPIKSLTRPNALRQRVLASGFPGVALELITTPLESKRNRLNGSGVLLFNAPGDSLAALAGTAPTLGSLCATQVGQWRSHLIGWANSSHR